MPGRRPLSPPCTDKAAQPGSRSTFPPNCLLEGTPTHILGKVGLTLGLKAQVGLEQAEMRVKGIQVRGHVEVGRPGHSKGKPTTKRALEKIDQNSDSEARPGQGHWPWEGVQRGNKHRQYHNSQNQHILPGLGILQGCRGTSSSRNATCVEHSSPLLRKLIVQLFNR